MRMENEKRRYGTVGPPEKEKKMPNYELLKQAPFSLGDASVTWVRETLEGMSEDEKIGQLFHLVTYTSDEDALRALCETYKPGGMMARMLPLEEACRVSNALQKYSKIPMLISANFEAGGDGMVAEGTNVGPNMMIAATGDPENARRQGEVAASEGMAVGANYAFAPVIDIDNNFRNPITNTRTYGSDPAFVAAAGEAFTRAVQAKGMAVSIKHFPGDGCDERDQHLVTSINSLSTEEWDKTYGMVYRRSIEAGALTVMVGHIMQPAYSRALVPGIRDEDILPATLAPELLRGLLRGKLGFNGMIITDSSTMAGMCVPMDRRVAVPRAIAAGCDMFLFTKNIDEDYGYMKAGLENGILTRERLDEAVMRILGVKAALRLPEKRADGSIFVSPEAAREVVGCAAHREIEREVTDRGVTLVKEKENLLPLSPAKHRRVLLIGLRGGENAFGTGGGEDIEAATAEALRKEGFDVTVFKPAKGFEGLMAPYADVVDRYDLILYVSNLATKSNQTTVRIEWASPMGANCPSYLSVVPTVFVSFANPYHLLDVPRIKTFINAYKFKDATVRAVVDKLLGRSPFTGVSPVDAFCGKWDTHL